MTIFHFTMHNRSNRTKQNTPQTGLVGLLFFVPTHAFDRFLNEPSSFHKNELFCGNRCFSWVFLSDQIPIGNVLPRGFPILSTYLCYTGSVNIFPYCGVPSLYVSLFLVPYRSTLVHLYVLEIIFFRVKLPLGFLQCVFVFKM